MERSMRFAIRGEGGGAMSGLPLFFSPSLINRQVVILIVWKLDTGFYFAT